MALPICGPMQSWVLPPQSWRGFLGSALGGNRLQIGGPAGAFIVLTYSIIQRHGYDDWRWQPYWRVGDLDYGRSADPAGRRHGETGISRLHADGRRFCHDSVE